VTDFVFAGPSLPPAEVTALLPGATVLPPVAHGDLLRLGAGPGDRVLMIDGLFLHSAPVRHKEILALLERGVTVAGASSMGALRAAEMWQFGMRGVGEVFGLYRDGVVTGDDEVAVVHGLAEDGHRSMSEPLVNIRIALGRAVAAGAVTRYEADQLLEIARELPFQARGYRALERAAQAASAAGPAERFLTWQRHHPCDAKGDDARLLLSMAAAGAPALRPHGPGDGAIEFLNTRFLDAWDTRYAGRRVGEQWVTDRDVAGVLMLLHPEYPHRHRLSVLAGLAGLDPTDPAVPDVEDRALAVARDRGIGIHDGQSHPDGPAWEWLNESERGLSGREATLRMLVRAFGVASYRSLASWMTPACLGTPQIADAAARIAAAAARLNDTAIPKASGPNRPGGRLHFRTETVDRTFADLWGCGPAGLEAAAWDRGFAELESFRLAAEPLVAYVKTFGAPDLPAA
jgi:hypothetical protein